MRRLLSCVLGALLPMERGLPDIPPPQAPDPDALLADGTVPADGPPDGEVTPEPPAGTPSEGETRTDLAEDTEASLRARVLELETKEQKQIQAEAESLLFEMLPELPEQIEENRRLRETATPPAEQSLTDDAFGEPSEVSLEDRLAQLEDRQRQSEIRQQSDRLVAHLEGLKRSRYPELDVTRALQIIAQSGQREVNVEKVAEVVNNQAVQSHEAYLRRRMQDPAFVNRLVQQTGQPPSTESPATPPPVPRQSGTTPGQERPAPTYKNATKELIARLRAKGWGQQGEVGPEAG